MTILLPTLAVAFGSFCVWLGVRVYNRRERWSKWTLVVAIVLAYPLSVGPWSYAMGRLGATSPFIAATAWIYWPLNVVMFSCPDFVADRYRGYYQWWDMQGMQNRSRDCG
jgi:hypothetical protein